MSNKSINALIAGGGMAVLIAGGFALGWYSAGKPQTPIVRVELFAVEASTNQALHGERLPMQAPEELAMPKAEEETEEIAPAVVEQAPTWATPRQLLGKRVSLDRTPASAKGTEPVGDRVSLPIRSYLPAEALVMNRRQQSSESELRQELLKVTEVRFDQAKAQEVQLTERFSASMRSGALFHAPDEFASWPELQGLPFRAKTECRLDEPAAKNLQALSRTVRSMLTEVGWIHHPI